MEKRKYNNTKAWNKNHRFNDEGMIERKCTNCGEWKLENGNNFYLHNKTKPEKGYSSECIVCACQRSIRDRHKDLEKTREKDREQYYKRRETELPRMRQDYYNRMDERKEYQKQWLKSEHGKQLSKQYSFNRRHKNHNINKVEWEECKKYFDYKCAYCGLPLEDHYITYRGVTKLGDFHKEHVDHKGINNLSNCVPSCGNCNSSKREEKYEDWYGVNNYRYSEERHNKIIKWLNEDYKKYIEETKPKRVYIRKNKSA